MDKRDLKAEFERLNIISFDCSGIATEEDVFTAIDAIDAHVKEHTDAEIHSAIDELKRERAARRFKGGSE